MRDLPSTAIEGVFKCAVAEAIAVMGADTVRQGLGRIHLDLEVFTLHEEAAIFVIY